MTNSLGSFDPNVLPMDAFDVRGKATDARRVIGLKEPWMFGTAVASAKWTLGVGYAPGDVVYHDEDGLVYMNLAATDAIEPDYSDAGIEGTTWKWVSGSIGGFVSDRGWWTKFADGTLIQVGSCNFSVFSTLNTSIGLYGWSFLFASATVTAPIAFHSVEYYGTATSNTQFSAPFFQNIDASSFYVGLAGYTASATTVSWIAHGRWKA